MFSLASGYSFFPWYDWLKMIVPCQCEVGILVSPKVDESDLWWYQDMLSMWGRMGFHMHCTSVPWGDIGA